MYRIAEAKGVENLIAGAWGCGVFMQDPSTVATLLVNAARNYNIPNIYFAIPNRNSRNFRIFLEVLEKLTRLKYVSRETSHASIAFLLEKLYWGSKEVSYRNKPR